MTESISGTTAELPQASILFDSENLFWSFGGWAPPVDDPERIRERASERRELLFPAVPIETVNALGSILAADLVDWLESRYVAHDRHGYGKPNDHGVRASLDELTGRGFVHHPVPWGKDEADRALEAEMNHIVQASIGGGTIVIGGADDLYLRSALAHREADPRWHFLAVLPDSQGQGIERFTNGDFRSFDVTASDLIRKERHTVRRADAVARAKHRARLRRLFAAIARPAGETQMERLGLASMMVAMSGPLPEPGWVVSAEWSKQIVARLAKHWPDGRDLATAMVGWAVEDDADLQHASAEGVAETLFRSAIHVCLDDAVDSQTAALLRMVVSMRDERMLLPLERAILSCLP